VEVLGTGWHNHRAGLLILALLVAGCSTTARHGLTPAWQQTKYTLNTVQACSADPEVIRFADLLVVLYTHEATRAGLVTYEQAARALDKPRPGFCVVQRPEPCKVAGVCAMGSKGPDCSPKSGCGSYGFAWGSAEWPAGVTSGWKAHLAHEARHMLGEAWQIPQRADHQDALGPVEVAVQRHLLAMGEL